jgi:transporter family-2 protein
MSREGLLFLAWAFLTGAVLPWQAGANTRMGQHAPSWFHAAFVNFVVGTLLLAVVAAILKGPGSLVRLFAGGPPTWWAWTGGLIGAFYVASLVLVIPKIGTVLFLAASVLGQLLGSAIVDQFGLMGLPKQELSTTRIVAIVLIAAGTVALGLEHTRTK